MTWTCSASGPSNFTFEVGSGIENVVVRKLRLSWRTNRGERITLEAGTLRNPDGLCDLLDRAR